MASLTSVRDGAVTRIIPPGESKLLQWKGGCLTPLDQGEAYMEMGLPRTDFLGRQALPSIGLSAFQNDISVVTIPQNNKDIEVLSMSDDEEDDNVEPKKYDAISPESPHASLIYSSESGNGDAIIDQWSDLESTDESDDGCNESDAASTLLSEHIEEVLDDDESADFVGVESKKHRRLTAVVSFFKRVFIRKLRKD